MEYRCVKIGARSFRFCENSDTFRAFDIRRVCSTRYHANILILCTFCVCVLQIQRLLDLPTTLETADQQHTAGHHSSSHLHSSQQRVSDVSSSSEETIPTFSFSGSFTPLRSIANYKRVLLTFPFLPQLYDSTLQTPSKPAPLPPRHPPSDTRRLSSHMSRNSGYSPHNGKLKQDILALLQIIRATDLPK